MIYILKLCKTILRCTVTQLIKDDCNLSQRTTWMRFVNATLMYKKNRTLTRTSCLKIFTL